MDGSEEKLKYRELLLGCGNSRTKIIHVKDTAPEWRGLTTLDIVGEPDVKHDLNRMPYPFLNDEFDEIHAYEVLEHCGFQGDWRFFFKQWEEFHRIIKPGGIFAASVPRHDSPWAWGDPGHTRIITLESLTFLDQLAYETQIGKTAMTDYREVYKAHWQLAWSEKQADNLLFVLRAVK